MAVFGIHLKHQKEEIEQIKDILSGLGFSVRKAVLANPYLGSEFYTYINVKDKKAFSWCCKTNRWKEYERQKHLYNIVYFTDKEALIKEIVSWVIENG